MFENLSDRLQSVMRTLTGRGHLKEADIDRLHDAMRNVNLHDGQTMNVCLVTGLSCIRSKTQTPQ